MDIKLPSVGITLILTLLWISNLYIRGKELFPWWLLMIIWFIEIFLVVFVTSMFTVATKNLENQVKKKL